MVHSNIDPKTRNFYFFFENARPLATNHVEDKEAMEQQPRTSQGLHLRCVRKAVVVRQAWVLLKLPDKGVQKVVCKLCRGVCGWQLVTFLLKMVVLTQ